MIGTSAISLPVSFGSSKARDKFKSLLIRRPKTMISLDFMNGQPLYKSRLNKAILLLLFKVNLGDVDLVGLKLKPCLKHVFRLIDEGYEASSAVTNYIKEFCK